MNITIIGSGYVGLVTGACLANEGNRVTCLMLTRIKQICLKLLNSIYEPAHHQSSLCIDPKTCNSLNAQKAIESVDVIFIAVAPQALIMVN